MFHRPGRERARRLISDEPGPVLVEVSRGPVVESWHRGALILLAPDGSVDLATGVVDAPMLPRSALKPVQAAVMVEHGYPGRDELLAVAAASHRGTGVHRRAVTRILADAGVPDTMLRCPPALPADEQTMLDHVHRGGRPERWCHACSGKHAAMLATCRAAGWSLPDYCRPEHPLQLAVRRVLEELTDRPVDGVTVDGCGAPAFAVPLRSLAEIFRRIVLAPEDTPAGTVRDAMRAHPLLIKGPGRSTTELTEAVPGLLCKDGAEGVWAAALPDGRAFAVKVDDGASRTLPVLLAAVLAHWGVDPRLPAMRRWSTVGVLGGGQRVGCVRPSEELLTLLRSGALARHE